MPTRWNSVFHMLNLALSSLKDSQNLQIRGGDIDIGERLIKLFEGFSYVCQSLQSSNHGTIYSLIKHDNDFKNELEEESFTENVTLVSLKFIPIHKPENGTSRLS